MKTRGVIGRRIVEVRQERCYGDGHLPGMHVELVLDNGCVLVPIVSELACDYAVDFIIRKPMRGSPRPTKD